MPDVRLGDMECLIGLSERGIGYIVQRSPYIRDHDILMEEIDEDNGFEFSFYPAARHPGIYRCTIHTWSHQDHTGEWEVGIDVLIIQPLWVNTAINLKSKSDEKPL